jgi:YD repeat-containing protein
MATRDPLGRETTIAYDAFDLLPVAVTDPVGLTTNAVYDYRVMQPIQVTNDNDRLTLPLGLRTRPCVGSRHRRETANWPVSG